MTKERRRDFPAGRASTPSFSLVEMLVAMAILSIIVVILLSMTTSLMSTWQFGQARDERRTVGQAALDRIARDLRQAAMPMNRSGTNLEFVINPSGVSANYEFPQAVFWQAPVATDGGTNGNLAIVGYFVQWVNGTPSLCRSLINPSSSSYSIYSNPPTTWITDSIIQSCAPATASSGYAGLLANNVLALWVQTLDPSGNPISQSGGGVAGESFDSRLPYSYTNSVYTVATTNMPSALPASVQIAILVLDSRTARRLTGNEKPTALTGNFWGDIYGFTTHLPVVIQKGSEVQTMTVDLARGPR
jgi:prepilin-type N-terminal cleavage/methylation domain-containing protein